MLYVSYTDAPLPSWTNQLGQPQRSSRENLALKGYVPAGRAINAADGISLMTVFSKTRVLPAVTESDGPANARSPFQPRESSACYSYPTAAIWLE